MEADFNFEKPARIKNVRILKSKKPWPTKSDLGLAKLLATDWIKTPEIKGPWKTKSGGELRVLFSVPFQVLFSGKKDPLSGIKRFFEIGDQIASGYFSYNKKELEKIPTDIRGFRSYTVSGLEKGSVGAMEFHKIRKELLFAIKGSAEIEVEDLEGGERKFIVNDETGLYIPSYLLHTYRVLENNTKILVVANTLYIPEKQETHDSFSIEVFRGMQKKAKVYKP